MVLFLVNTFTTPATENTSTPVVLPSTSENTALLLNDRFADDVAAYLQNPDAKLDEQFVAALRRFEYEGLEWLQQYYPTKPSSNKEYLQQTHALKLYDKVSGQKDGLYSQLFWHTDLEAAKAVAKQRKKPIISLRMLGDFTEDLSCANSRFFRMLLYSDAEVNRFLKYNFVLHVSSVIDVPQITITYPDGTVQKQTITGNSMHVAMDENGEIIDALPGLYGPEYFKVWLGNMRFGKEHDSYTRYNNRLLKASQYDMEHLWENENLINITNSLLPSIKVADVNLASMIPVGKSVIEQPVIRKIKLNRKTKQASNYQPPTYHSEHNKWRRQLDELGFKQELLSKESIRLIQCKKRYANDTALDKQVNDITHILTQENIRNEINLHTRIANWLNEEQPDLRNQEQAFIEKVYAELFLTPLNDKKMGMYQQDLFYGLTNDGF